MIGNRTASRCFGGLMVLASCFFSGPAHAQRPGWVIVPHSSIERPFDRGHFAHTNHLIFMPALTGLVPLGGTGFGGGIGPADIRAAYNLPASGGSGVIAIVDAYHDPYALSDFNKFSAYYGLPVETSTNPTASSNKVFQVIYASGSKPRYNTGWSQEASLDIEWAHAMAPNAKVVLVEAASNRFSDLFKAVKVASGIPGVQEISMSWGGSEFSGETAYDAYFQHSGIVYFAASGDTGGVVEYPSASAWVVSAGGTTLTLNNGVFVSETGWSGSGGGPSAYETKPSYQTNVTNTFSMRSTPDLSFDADPNTGVTVVWKGSWYIFGGTSVSAPSLAGIVNLAGHVNSSSTSLAELQAIYSSIGTSNVRDIVVGNNGYPCLTGWDAVTGVGAPLGTGGL
ncbi:MAG: S53 family peptidase [Chthonomonadales bacterium]